MIIANLYGGIGNQLFQYCFVHAIAKRNGQRVYLNKVGFKDRSDGHGEFLLDGVVFKGMDDHLLCKKFESVLIKSAWKMSDIFIPRNTSKSEMESIFLKRARHGFLWTHRAEKLFSSWEELSVKVPFLFVDGYFQWPELMKDIIDNMKENVFFRLSLDSKNAEYMDRIINSESVCMHIRRGDYLNFPSLQVCNYDYYYQGMKWILSCVRNPVFFVFSDDIDWVQDNYFFPGNVIYIKGKNISSIELHLMCSCKHFILSNSSFGWWAQALCKNNEKYVVVPSPWYADGRRAAVYLEDFHIIRTQGSSGY